VSDYLSPTLTRPRETVCPGCGLALSARPEAPKHAYYGASAECWALNGELLAREFQDPARFPVHQLSVDTYAVQHPGVPERRSIQSVGLHLMTLCLILEDGADPLHGPRLHKRFLGRPAFHWLEPPQPNGHLTVAYPLRSQSWEEHRDTVHAWARDVWDAWATHHHTIRSWIEQSLT